MGAPASREQRQPKQRRSARPQSQRMHQAVFSSAKLRANRTELTLSRQHQKDQRRRNEQFLEVARAKADRIAQQE